MPSRFSETLRNGDCSCLWMVRESHTVTSQYWLLLSIARLNVFRLPGGLTAGVAGMTFPFQYRTQSRFHSLKENLRATTHFLVEVV